MKLGQKIKNVIAEKNFLNLLISSVVIVGVLVCALFSMKYLGEDNAQYFKLFAFMTFLFLTFSRIPLAFEKGKDLNSRIIMIKNICFSAIYFVLSLLFLFLNYDLSIFAKLCAVYMFTVTANRICICITRRKSVFMIVFNTILAILASILMVSFFAEKEYFGACIALSLEIVFIVSLIEVLLFSFSRMRLRGILKIMKETYAFEILYGLIVLVISFSIYFMFNEESVHSLSDGLWYSFAVVTTIGFGDITVTSPISRILSVILGIYGLIVVAVLTSVIVNFYNEKKDNKKDKSDDTDHLDF